MLLEAASLDNLISVLMRATVEAGEGYVGGSREAWEILHHF